MGLLYLYLYLFIIVVHSVLISAFNRIAVSGVHAAYLKYVLVSSKRLELSAGRQPWRYQFTYMMGTPNCRHARINVSGKCVYLILLIACFITRVWIVIL